MLTRIRGGFSLKAATLAVVAGLALVASDALAQPGTGGGRGQGGGQGGGGPGGRMGGGPGGGMGGRMGDFNAPAIERRNMDKYAGVLGLSADQKEVAESLLEGYEQQTRELRESMRTKMEEIRDKARDTGDMSVWGEMREIGERAQADRKKLDASLMTDLKSILSPEQEERWPVFERAQRRDQSLRRGFVSGERVNLFELVDRSELEPAQKQALDPILGEYDVELDRALQARNAAYESAFGQFGRMFGGEGGPDMEKAQEAMDKGREAAFRVRDVNRRFARQIGEAMPEDKRPGFANAFLRESFPEVYRPTQAARSVEAALGLADLTTEQKESVAALRESYTRSLETANAKMREAIEKQESEATVAGMMQRFGRGGQGEDPMGDIRRERRELGDTTVESLKKILTPEQAERLPTAEDRGGPGGQNRGGEDAPAPRRRNRPVQDPT